MRKIFIVRGIAARGKTTTLNRLIQLLENQYPDTIVERRPIGSNGDQLVIFLIQGVRIGFITEGDWHDVVLDSLRELHMKGCEILFCASRTRLSSRRAIDTFIQESRELESTIYLPMVRVLNEEMNEAQTDRVVAEFRTWLVGIN